MHRKFILTWPLMTGLAHFIYLSIPLFKGKPKNAHLLHLSDRVKANLPIRMGKLYPVRVV